MRRIAVIPGDGIGIEVTREAVRALGQVRVQTVKNLGQVDSRPAFVLLKVARNDIPSLWPRDPPLSLRAAFTPCGASLTNRPC